MERSDVRVGRCITRVIDQEKREELSISVKEKNQHVIRTIASL
jgi:hypothetical protein